MLSFVPCMIQGTSHTFCGQLLPGYLSELTEGKEKHMKSDETAYQELLEELERYEHKGIYISMDGFPASPMQIVTAHMTREEGSYMRDYILDTEGYIESLSFVNINRNEQA